MTYAALGDSMSIDDYAGGPGRGAASLLWRNCDEDFPEWSGRDVMSRGSCGGYVLLARDGATSQDVAAGQLPALKRLGAPPALATVTMGGNDLLSAFGDDDAARSAIEGVAIAGRHVLSGLRDLMGPDAPIVVATVYDPGDGTGAVDRLGLPPWPAALELIGTLNEMLRQVAAAFGACVADVHDRFLGHGLEAGDPNQPDPRPADRSLWYCGLVEPNAWGASEIRAAFWAAVDR